MQGISEVCEEHCKCVGALIHEMSYGRHQRHIIRRGLFGEALDPFQAIRGGRLPPAAKLSFMDTQEQAIPE